MWVAARIRFRSRSLESYVFIRQYYTIHLVLSSIKVSSDLRSVCSATRYFPAQKNFLGAGERPVPLEPVNGPLLCALKHLPITFKRYKRAERSGGSVIKEGEKSAKCTFQKDVLYS